MRGVLTHSRSDICSYNAAHCSTVCTSDSVSNSTAHRCSNSGAVGIPDCIAHIDADTRTVCCTVGNTDRVAHGSSDTCFMLGCPRRSFLCQCQLFDRECKVQLSWDMQHVLRVLWHAGPGVLSCH